MQHFQIGLPQLSSFSSKPQAPPQLLAGRLALQQPHEGPSSSGPVFDEYEPALGTAWFERQAVTSYPTMYQL